MVDVETPWSPIERDGASVPNDWSPDWRNAVFSLAERDRRWTRVRELMRRDAIDLIVCLPWTSYHDHAQADPRYLTQLGENSDETTVAFPIEGEVTAWHSRGGVWPSSNWLGDIRAAPRGTGGQTIVSWLNESGFDRGTIGIAGLTGGSLSHCRTPHGEVNWQSVDIIKQALPHARFVSATDLQGEARRSSSSAKEPGSRTLLSKPLWRTLGRVSPRRRRGRTCCVPTLRRGAASSQLLAGPAAQPVRRSPASSSQPVGGCNPATCW
jgi:hypothetical protein